MLTLMSGLLILVSCFSTVLASEISHTNEKSYAINLDKVATHVINTAKNMITWGGASFGLAFMPTGTPIFAMGTTFILFGNELIKIRPGVSETERFLRDFETLLVIGSGIAGHAAGCYCLIKLIQTTLEAVK